jgi:hypothetical protein
MEGTLSRTNFENLEVYKLAERLADEIWSVVLRWDYFLQGTLLGSNLFALRTALGPISLRGQADAVSKTTGVLLEPPEHP